MTGNAIITLRADYYTNDNLKTAGEAIVINNSLSSIILV